MGVGGIRHAQPRPARVRRGPSRFLAGCSLYRVPERAFSYTFCGVPAARTELTRATSLAIGWKLQLGLVPYYVGLYFVNFVLCAAAGGGSAHFQLVVHGFRWPGKLTPHGVWNSKATHARTSTFSSFCFVESLASNYTAYRRRRQRHPT